MLLSVRMQTNDTINSIYTIIGAAVLVQCFIGAHGTSIANLSLYPRSEGS